MIKGDKVRPLIIKGDIYFSKNILGKIIKNKSSEIKDNCIQVLTLNNLDKFQKGYSCYIFESNKICNHIKQYLEQNLITYLINVKSADTLCENDVIEIHGNSGIINILYRDDSYDNVLVLTNQCNSNCIFCPESINYRKRKNFNNVERIKKIIDLIPSDTHSLCITGGEPTLYKEKLFEILRSCKEKFQNTNFIMLSNGRMFYYKDYAINYVKSRPNGTVIAIALHGNNSTVHDMSTRVNNSFKQTITGLKNLYDLGEKIEIRIVVNKLNYKILPSMAKMISKNFPNIFRVNIMGLEMLGNAALNKEKVWINFNESSKFVNKAVCILLLNGITTNLYNFPLCYINKELWQISAKSISDYKVRYTEKCLDCKVKNLCGGFFESTYKLGKVNVKPVK
ncbi:His-Xaa-Ser system radical SAM maturase HxsC (plasmid) [Haloimpatiens sp. FM7330]|uniref:His-Xaa-Ser system radical SAM maturase HxsC n=1 Tax=Haloimpatiens sp. FM7330 TaxID=3298610 RepID=UPI00364448E3